MATYILRGGVFGVGVVLYPTSVSLFSLHGNVGCLFMERIA